MKTLLNSRNLAFILLLVVLCLLNVSDLAAQCPMCRATAESNLAHGGSSGRGLNAGILYMLATPYLIVGVIAYIWLRNRKKQDAPQEPTIQN